MEGSLMPLRNRDTQRLTAADQALSDALASLTRAVCLLGLSEGKVTVQLAHGLVRDTHRFIQRHNAIEPEL